MTDPNADPHSELTTPARSRIKWIVTLTLLGLVVLIGLQNIRATEITVLLWNFHMPLIVVIVLSYAVGVTVGWLWWPFTRSGPRRD
jgi:uncharacterized integral membrane protein